MAVTVTYLEVGDVLLNSTTPPTPTQSLNASSVVATVLPSANADAAATISHGFGLSSLELQKGFPLVFITGLDALAQTSNWYVASLDPNYVGLAKANLGGGADTVPQIKVNVQRPHTITR